jgi:hypothetical protein
MRPPTRSTGTTNWRLPIAGLCVLVLVACLLVATQPTIHHVAVYGR